MARIKKLEIESNYNCSDDSCCGCEKPATAALPEESTWKKYLPVTGTGILFVIGILLDFLLKPTFFTGTSRLAWYIAAYLPVALPAFRHAGSAMAQKNFFNEFTLMIVATLGAFFIGEYPEGVAVMLFTRRATIPGSGPSAGTAEHSNAAGCTSRHGDGRPRRGNHHRLAGRGLHRRNHTGKGRREDPARRDAAIAQGKFQYLRTHR